MKISLILLMLVGTSTTWANDTPDEVDICYSGDFEKATDSIAAPVSVNVIDIYGAGQLDAEFYNDDSGDSTYGIIPSC